MDNETSLHKNIFCDPSLEPSRQDGSNEGPQHMLSLKNKKLSSVPPLIWSSVIYYTIYLSI